jgi:hypothetical protein
MEGAFIHFNFSGHAGRFVSSRKDIFCIRPPLIIVFSNRMDRRKRMEALDSDED